MDRRSGSGVPLTVVVLAASPEQLERWRIDAEVLGGCVVADPDFACLQLGGPRATPRAGDLPAGRAGGAQFLAGVVS